MSAMMRRLALSALVASCAIASAVAVGASATACGDLKNANENEEPQTEAGGADGDGATPEPATTDAATDAATDASGRGPGPHGSLPSGYCCNDDIDCRYRHCADPSASGGAGKMCLDECYGALICTRPDITFSCVQPDAGQQGLCKPPAGFACIPADQFLRGTLPVGACCNAGSPSMNDGTAGSACEGNQCAATGSGPLVCTNRCSFQADCPGGFVCTLFGTSKACVPTTASYTCN